MVFISYNHNDEGFAERLALELAKHHIKVWKDSWRIGVGSSLIEKIQSGLEGARFFCVILSHNSLASEWVKRELTAGLLREIEERRVMILPIVIDDCKVPLLIRDKLYADFRGDFDSGVRKLLSVLLPHYRVQAGGRIASADRYFLHYRAQTAAEDGRLECDVEAVSFDLEETYSILTHFNFSGREGIDLEVLGVDSLASVTEMVLDACVQEAKLRPAYSRVVPGTVNQSRFLLQDLNGEPLFDARMRVAPLGEFRRGAVPFDVGAVAEQILEAVRANS